MKADRSRKCMDFTTSALESKSHSDLQSPQPVPQQRDRSHQPTGLLYQTMAHTELPFMLSGLLVLMNGLVLESAWGTLLASACPACSSLTCPLIAYA